MLRGVDHLVIAVRDLDAAVRDYTALGFTVVPGGRHAAGTHNALVALADGAYLELLAFYEPYPAHRWWAALERGGGLVDFCLQTDDLAADTQAFRRAGVALSDPRPSVRTRPDGYEVKWVLALSEGPQRGVAPFLIRDETPRAERVPSATRHPNGATGLAAVTLAAADLDHVRDWYAAASGRAGENLRREDLDAGGLRFRIGPHALEVLQPLQSGRGPLAAWLESRGPGPYAARFTGAAPRGALDERLTHGARISIG